MRHDVRHAVRAGFAAVALLQCGPAAFAGSVVAGSSLAFRYAPATANTIMTGEISPSSLYHATTMNIPISICTVIAKPGSGQTLVVQQVRVSFQDVPSSSTLVQVFEDSKCTTPVGEILTEGGTAVSSGDGWQFTIAFGAGLKVPSGSKLFAKEGPSNFGADVFVDGYIASKN